MTWIAVDLDGTLAEYHGWNGGKIGPPIPRMVERVRAWVKDGKEVRIFTARVANSGKRNIYGDTDGSEFVAGQVKAIEAWCKRHIGRVLPVTATKDFECVAIYDDRAYTVRFNTGKLLEENQFGDLVKIARAEAKAQYGAIPDLPHKRLYGRRPPSGLTDKQRAMIVVSYKEGRDKGDIAKDFGVSLAAVAQALRRAKEKGALD